MINRIIINKTAHLSQKKDHLFRKRGLIETKVEEEHETAKLNVNHNHFNNKVSSILGRK